MKTAVVIFDVFGTLFQLDPLGKKLEQLGLPGALKLWFSRTLRDAFALEAAGVFKPFREVAGGALEVLLAENGQSADRRQIDGVLDAFKELPPWPDVKSSIERLHERGVRIATLGNGSRDVAKTLLERAGVADSFEAILSIEEARHWKPHAGAYQYALRTLGVQAQDAALVAAHAWDVMGARRAGLRGVYVSRLEKRFQPALDEAALAGDSVSEAIEKLI